MLSKDDRTLGGSPSTLVFSSVNQYNSSKAPQANSVTVESVIIGILSNVFQIEESNFSKLLNPTKDLWVRSRNLFVQEDTA